jgi:hydroxypyruvate reductase
VDERLFLRQLFDEAVASAQPACCILPYLPEVPRGRMIVVGAGKASAAMARAVEDHWPGKLSGLVVTPYGYAVPCRSIEILEAAHPVADEAGLRAARRMLDLVRDLTPQDLVLCLISGGGSALLPLPLGGLKLADEQALGRALLKSGAGIGDMNCVRRHLSSIKGGRLAAACHPARVLSLAISDVPGDRPLDIASGPTVGDPTTCEDALGVVRRFGIKLPRGALGLLESGEGESIKPEDPRLAAASMRIVAAPQMALEAAAQVARAAGLTPYILGDSIEGEARPRCWARWRCKWRSGASRFNRPACCCPAERPPSRCAALAGADATSSSCWRWLWPSAAGRRCMHWRQTPTGSMGRNRSRARTSVRTP